MAKILNILPSDDYTLTIELNNHHKIIYDMKPRLQTVRFSQLADINRFKAVWVKNENILIWDSLCQITIDEIISNIGR
ncbi:hypothetical protein J2Z76_000272 [Sedimentibacter acidaminivorans]|uniref:DUF2442 domain-containing protein n=1 Tax=Sedimentibacter acidaminivorans TaxID=913099 RepID=A0ABS4G9R6_9FIRM|nr:DUF2442 domain-containing protein [Sedimentibacter acidaminivorans]MBP1924419.1 hypothetical protein [Sedimentibacter acidaminivorans]